eukprot:2089169-Pleurochrysis_carterae.AAC.1
MGRQKEQGRQVSEHMDLKRANMAGMSRELKTRGRTAASKGGLIDRRVSERAHGLRLKTRVDFGVTKPAN